MEFSIHHSAFIISSLAYRHLRRAQDAIVQRVSFLQKLRNRGAFVGVFFVGLMQQCLMKIRIERFAGLGRDFCDAYARKRAEQLIVHELQSLENRSS